MAYAYRGSIERKDNTCTYRLGFHVPFPVLTDSRNMSVRLLLLIQLMTLITMRSVTVNSVKPSTHQPTKPLNNIQCNVNH